MKRTADDVSDLELPQGSRPMLALDRTRHRPANPQRNLVEQSSGISPSQATAVSPVALSGSQPNLVEQSSGISPSQATEVPSPASSHSRSLESNVASAQPTASPSGPSTRSPAEQSMLQEALEKGRSEGRQEIQAKLDEAELKLEEIKRQLDPTKFKEGYDLGFREGGKRVYDMCKRNHEAKANEDRLAFQQISDEKDLAIHDQQLTMSNYQKELMARRRRIADLEQRVTVQLGQNISGQQILNAEARFNTQAQELAVEKNQNQLMMAELGNCQAGWNLISADLEKWKAAFSIKDSQLDAYKRQHDDSTLELKESRDQAEQLAATNSELTKLAAERLAEIELIKALNGELNGNAKQMADGKEEINALTIQNTKLTKVRGGLEETVTRQENELQDLLARNDELARELWEKNPDNTPNQTNKEQAEETDDLPVESVPETALADLELVRVMVEREREATGAESARRDQRVMATLGSMEESERIRRQALIDELEDKDAQLYDAQKKIMELTKRLPNTSSTQPSPSLPSAPFSSQSPPEELPSRSEPSPIPTHPPSAVATSSLPSDPRSWFHLVTVVATNFSPRRLTIFLSVFLLAYLPFYLPSVNRISATEDSNSGQVAFGVLPVPADPADFRSEGEEERRRLVQIWAWRNWERNERMFRGEEPDESDREYKPILGLDF